MFFGIPSHSNITKKIVRDIPILIDDECDQASVNTKKIEYDNTGKEISILPKPMKIRTLLSIFEKMLMSVIRQHHLQTYLCRETDSDNFGEDLFPRNFIVTSQHQNYRPRGSIWFKRRYRGRPRKERSPSIN